MNAVSEHAVFIFLVQLFAYSIKGLIGFGNPLIAGPLLSLRFDNVIITPGTLIGDLPINFYLAWKNRKEFQFKRLLPLIICMLAGGIPGILLLRFSVPKVLKTVLGVFVIFLGIEMAGRKIFGQKGRTMPDWVAYPVAVLSGFFAGLFGINMLLVAYLERSSRNYEDFKGSICCVFFCENAVRLLFYLAAGMLSHEILLFGVATLLASFGGILVSSFLGRFIDGRKLVPAAIVMFILGGLNIALKSLS